MQWVQRVTPDTFVDSKALCLKLVLTLVHGSSGRDEVQAQEVPQPLPTVTFATRRAESEPSCLQTLTTATPLVLFSIIVTDRPSPLSDLSSALLCPSYLPFSNSAP